VTWAELEDDLIQATRDGDLTEVDRLIGEGANVDSQDE